MPPTGGFGGNTGIHDAHNLAWKLDAVLRGAAGPRLLDSYDLERKPLAERTLAQALARLGAWFKDPDTKLPPSETIVADEAVIFGHRYGAGALVAEPDTSPQDPEDFETRVSPRVAPARGPRTSSSSGPASPCPRSIFSAGDSSCSPGPAPGAKRPPDSRAVTDCRWSATASVPKAIWWTFKIGGAGRTGWPKAGLCWCVRTASSPGARARWQPSPKRRCVRHSPLSSPPPEPRRASSPASQTWILHACREMAVPEPGHSFRERVVDGHHPVQPPHPELAGLLGLRLASGFHRPSNLSSEAGQSSGSPLLVGAGAEE